MSTPTETAAPIEDFDLDPTNPDLLEKKGFSIMANGTYELKISECPKVRMSQNNNRVIDFKAIFSDSPNNYVLENLTITPDAIWKAAQWLNAQGIAEKVNTSKLCSPEFLATLVGNAFKADIGTKEILGKKPKPDGTLPILNVNEITQFICDGHDPNPYPVGQITGVGFGVAEYKMQLAAGKGQVAPAGSGATQQPLDQAVKENKMAF